MDPGVLHVLLGAAVQKFTSGGARFRPAICRRPDHLRVLRGKLREADAWGPLALELACCTCDFFDFLFFFPPAAMKNMEPH